MSTYTLAAPLSVLRAARTHAAEKDIRSYLCGVYFDTKAGKIVATDGHRLFCANARGVKRDVDPVIVPNELIDAALKQFTGDYARGKLEGAADVFVTVDGRSITIATPTGQVSGLALDGRYPDWRRVVPTGEDGVLEYAPAVCNYQYIADACDAIVTARNKTKKAAYEHGIRVHYRGEFSAIVTDGGADVLVIVMPMRHDIHAEAPIVACRMAHVDAIPQDVETPAAETAEAA